MIAGVPAAGSEGVVDWCAVGVAWSVGGLVHKLSRVERLKIDAFIIQIGEYCIAGRPSDGAVDGGGGVRRGS